jgi:hypothetical protein
MSEKLNPVEFMKRTAEAGRLKENDRKIQETTKKMVDNSGIFAGQIEEEKSHAVCQEIFADLGTNYKPDEKGSIVGGIEATLKNPTASDLQKTIAKENLNILKEAAFRSINFSFRDYPNGLITSVLKAEEIDEFLPKEMKGLGKLVVEKDSKLNENEKKSIMDTNDKVSNLLNDESVKVQDVLKDIVERTKDKPENSLEKQYGQLAISVILENKKIEVTGKPKKGDVDIVPFTKNSEGEWEGGSRWEISPEYAAEAMKFMDSGMRWQTYTPPEWMKKLDIETQKRIEYMIMINDGAASLNYFGKDLDKIQSNKMYFAFDNEKFTKLFNPDFKLVMSKMLNDLCEFDKDKNENKVDKNGQISLRYKEGINKKGDQGILESVETELENIRDYKEKLAGFLAEQNDRFRICEKNEENFLGKVYKKGDKIPDPNYMDKMNAYTAWNLFYMFGDSSVADRRRVLPTYGGVISDGLRTLNPEYKALGKWKISKGDIPQSDLDGAEWFGGPLGTYVQTVMQLERDLGHDIKDANGKITGHVDKPITGNKTLREKMIDKKMSILSTKTFYGFLDFTAGGRDLYDKNGDKFYDTKKGKNREETLSSLLMNYGFTKDGKLKSKDQREDFSFGNNQVDFLNWYRDQMESSALVLNATTGKEDTKNIKNFVSKIRTAFGMVDGININGAHPYKYTKDTDLWANMLLGSFGVDMQRLSTDSIYIRTTQPRAYNLNLGSFLTRGLRLTEHDVDLTKLMRRLGMDINDGENYDSLAVTIKNEFKWKQAKKATDELFRRSRKK